MKPGPISPAHVCPFESGEATGVGWHGWLGGTQWWVGASVKRGGGGGGCRERSRAECRSAAPGIGLRTSALGSASLSDWEWLKEGCGLSPHRTGLGHQSNQGRKEFPEIPPIRAAYATRRFSFFSASPPPHRHGLTPVQQPKQRLGCNGFFCLQVAKKKILQKLAPK